MENIEILVDSSILMGDQGAEDFCNNIKRAVAALVQKVPQARLVFLTNSNDEDEKIAQHSTVLSQYIDYYHDEIVYSDQAASALVHCIAQRAMDNLGRGTYTLYFGDYLDEKAQARLNQLSQIRLQQGLPLFNCFPATHQIFDECLSKLIAWAQDDNFSVIFPGVVHQPQSASKRCLMSPPTTAKGDHKQGACDSYEEDRPLERQSGCKDLMSGM